MTIKHKSGRIFAPRIRLAVLVLMFATGALLLLLSGSAALGAHVNPAVVATVPVGSDPSGVGVNAATGRVYVANQFSDNVSVIDGATNAVVATVPVGNGPYGVGVNAATGRVYVANLLSNNLLVIDGATNAVVATVQVGTFPVGVGVNAATGRVYVANQFSDNVSVIDGATNAVVATVPSTDPLGIGVNAATNRVYVANQASNTVSVIDGATNAVVATVPVGIHPFGVGVNAATNRVYVANQSSDNVSVVDGVTNAVVATVPVGTLPHDVGVNAATGRVYVANVGSDTVSVIDGATNAVVATVPVGSRPVNVGVNAATDRVYVANQSSNTVSVIGEEPNWQPLPPNTFDESGGTIPPAPLSSSNLMEASVSVPPGALSEQTTITITELSVNDPSLPPPPPKSFPIVFQFGPAGQQFAEDVTIILSYFSNAVPQGANEANAKVHLLVDGTYITVEACQSTDPPVPNPCVFARDTAANTVTIRTRHFSIFALSAPPNEAVGGIVELVAAPPDSTPSQSSDSGASPFQAVVLAVGVGALAVVGTGVWYVRKRRLGFTDS